MNSTPAPAPTLTDGRERSKLFSSRPSYILPWPEPTFATDCKNIQNFPHLKTIKSKLLLWNIHIFQLQHKKMQRWCYFGPCSETVYLLSLKYLDSWGCVLMLGDGEMLGSFVLWSRCQVLLITSQGPLWGQTRLSLVNCRTSWPLIGQHTDLIMFKFSPKNFFFAQKRNNQHFICHPHLPRILNTPNSNSVHSMSGTASCFFAGGFVNEAGKIG